MNFKVGDKVEVNIYVNKVQGTVIKANPESFQVKWEDGGFSTEQQNNTAGVFKVKQ